MRAADYWTIVVVALLILTVGLFCWLLFLVDQRHKKETQRLIDDHHEASDRDEDQRQRAKLEQVKKDLAAINRRLTTPSDAIATEVRRDLDQRLMDKGLPRLTPNAWLAVEQALTDHFVASGMMAAAHPGRSWERGEVPPGPDGCICFGNRAYFPDNPHAKWCPLYKKNKKSKKSQK